MTKESHHFGEIEIEVCDQHVGGGRKMLHLLIAKRKEFVVLKNTRFKGSSAVRALAVTGALMASGASFADPVTLKSVDGSVDLVGELLKFEKNVYTIKTVIGELNVSAEQVRCVGADCPVFEDVEADLVLAGSDTVGLGLMPLLLEGWAASQDAEASMINPPGSAHVVAQIVGDQHNGDWPRCV